jgi:hypothetical protein
VCSTHVNHYILSQASLLWLSEQIIERNGKESPQMNQSLCSLENRCRV